MDPQPPKKKQQQKTKTQQKKNTLANGDEPDDIPLYALTK